MRWLPRLACGVLAAVGAACDPLPIVHVHNTTPNPIVVQFQEERVGDYHLTDRFELKPGRQAQFSAGYTVDNHIVVVAGGCAYTYPLLREGPIRSGYGARTDLAVGSDLRLYVWDRRSPVQPKGWPISPTKTCR